MKLDEPSSLDFLHGRVRLFLSRVELLACAFVNDQCHSSGQTVVFLVRGGKAQQRPVVLGTARKGQVIVKDGLAGGETLVAQPPDGLADGDAVRIKA